MAEHNTHTLNIEHFHFVRLIIQFVIIIINNTLTYEIPKPLTNVVIIYCEKKKNIEKMSNTINL